MTRRNSGFILSLLTHVSVFFVGAAVAGVPSVGAATQSASRPPNVVFLLADDLGWMDASFQGNTRWQTPHLDALASRGMMFRESHSAAPICSPTRASIMTGLYPARLGITKPTCQVIEEVVQKQPMRADGPVGRAAIEPQSLTRLGRQYPLMSERFREAGYATGHFGKWHLRWKPYDPLARGFDEYLPRGEMSTRYFAPWNLVTGEADAHGKNMTSDTLFTGPAGEHLDDRMTAEAVAFLRRHKDRPFFLNLWFFLPHSPLQASDEETAAFMNQLDPNHPAFHPVYAAMITRLDRNVGTVMKALEDLGLADNTIVVFTSDNGGLAGYPSHAKVFPELEATSNHPARGGKGNAWDGGTRVPLVYAWPGHIPAGTVSHEVVSSIDHFPTLLDLCGLHTQSTPRFDGVSLKPALIDKRPLDRDAMYSLWPHYADWFQGIPTAWVRHGDWKLLRFFADGPQQQDRLALYNVVQDVGETTDLSAQHPGKVADLNHKISQFLADTEAVIPAPNPKLRPAARRAVEK